jgi:cold shock CspA family protein
LSSLNLDRYGENFAAAEVTLDLLPLLSLEDYADVGLSRQDGARIRDAIAPPAAPPRAPPVGVNPMAGGAGGNTSFLIGDWICGACENNNFARRLECRRCGTPRSSASTTIDEPTQGHQPAAPRGRAAGRLDSWVKTRGYGLIAPDHGGEKIFVHASALKAFGTKDLSSFVGTRVSYDTGTRQNKPIALDVRREGAPAPPPARPAPPPPARAAPARPAPPPRDDDVPEEFLCPITFEMMTDPVIAADGHTYERRAIEAWFSRARTSPVTNEPLEHLHLIPAHTIRSLIQRRLEA